MSATLSSQETVFPTPSKATAGIGEYSLPGGISYDAFISAKKTHLIVVFILCGIAAAVVTSFFFLPATAIPALAILITTSQALGYFAIAITAMKSALSWRGLNNLAPPIQELPFQSELLGCPKPGEWAVNHHLKVYSLINQQVANERKLEAIKGARRSIFMSGCYCRGPIFVKALEIIRSKLEKGELQEVRIHASSVLLEKKEKQIMGELQKQYPEKFCAIIHSELDVITNPEGEVVPTMLHAKVLLVDPPVTHNLGNHSAEEGSSSTMIIGGSGFCEPYWYNPVEEKKRSLGIFPAHFLDMDIEVFDPVGDPKSVISSVYLEMMKVYALMSRRYKDRNIFAKLKQCQLQPINSAAKSSQFNWQENKKSPALTPIHPEAFKVLVAHPEQSERSICQEIIEMVKSAKKTDEIFLANMFFMPPQELLEVLQEALKRGVHMTILTNGTKFGTSPGLHFGYGFAGKLFLSKLAQFAQDPAQLKVILNTERMQTLHHKVYAKRSREPGASQEDSAAMCIIGSPNLGPRSLNGADYEIALGVKSRALVDEMIKQIFNQLKSYSILSIEQLVHPSLFTRLAGKVQSFFGIIF